MTGNVGGVQETSTQHSNLPTRSFSSITQTVCLKSTNEKKVNCFSNFKFINNIYHCPDDKLITVTAMIHVFH